MLGCRSIRSIQRSPAAAALRSKCDGARASGRPYRCWTRFSRRLGSSPATARAPGGNLLSTFASRNAAIGSGRHQPPAGPVAKHAIARRFKSENGLRRSHAFTMKSAARKSTRPARSSSAGIRFAGIRLERVRVLTLKAWRIFALDQASELGYAATVEAIVRQASQRRGSHDSRRLPF
jgi:hypothetical protein